MQAVKHCLKKPDCQLWQVLCDGNPCIVEMEIEADSNVKHGLRNVYVELLREKGKSTGQCKKIITWIINNLSNGNRIGNLL